MFTASLERDLLIAALFAYIGAAWLFGSHVARTQPAGERRGAWVLSLGFAAHTLSLIVHLWEVGLLPVTSFGEGLSFFSWLVVGSFLVLGRGGRLHAIGVVVAALAALMVVGAITFFAESAPIPPELRSPWLPIHVTLAFLGNAIFGIAFAASLVYLFQEGQLKSHRGAWLLRRLPSLEQLDHLNHRCLVWGFPLLSLGILSGGLWAAKAWGHFWSGEAREVLSLVTWLVYAGLLQFRLTGGLRGRRAARLTILGFALVVISYVSISLLNLPGRHGNVLGS
jgi:cytochrome c-type biogenesis protein CcsB